MHRFHVIDEAAVITAARGVSRQQKVFERGGALYAGHGNGFIRLYAHGGTSVPAVRWDDIEIPEIHEPIADAHGKLSLPPPMRQIEGSAK